MSSNELANTFTLQNGEVISRSPDATLSNHPDELPGKDSGFSHKDAVRLGWFYGCSIIVIPLVVALAGYR